MSERLDRIIQVLTQAEQLVLEGEVERALRLARSAEEVPDQNDILLQLLARWNSAERDMLENLLSDDDFKVERAQVTKRFVQFLQETRTEVEQELAGRALPTNSQNGAEEWSLPTYDGRPQILLLYAQEDQALVEEMRKHLFLVMRDEALQFVDVHSAVPALVKDRLTYQERMVAAARTVIALVTPNSMSVPVFPLAEQAAKASKLIPIRVEEVGLNGTPFRQEIKGLPHDGRFISDWPNRNGAWVEVAQALQTYLTKLKEEA